MTDLPALLLSILDRPHMILPGNAEIIVRALLDRASVRLQGQSPRPQAAVADGLTIGQLMDAPLRTENGVAVVPVIGTLAQRTLGVEALCGLTSYQTVRADIEKALADPEVKAVLLDISSPGGEVAGSYQLYDWLMAQRAGTKPIWAIADEWACSAAYLIASSTSHIVAPRSAQMGSIGVVACHVDVSAQDKMLGQVWTAVYAGSHKMDYWSHAPMSSDAKTRLQNQIAATYDQFVSAIAGARPLDANAVRNTEALIFGAQDAVSQGLADTVANFDDTLTELAAYASGARVSVPVFSSGAAAAASSPANQEVSMADSKAAAPADNGAQVPATPAAAVPAAAATASISPTAVAPATDVKARIKAIQTSAEAQGREALASHLAFETEMSAEDAVKAMAAAPKNAAVVSATVTPFEAAMAAQANPKVTPGGASASADEGAAALLATAQKHGFVKGS
ncbi:MAG: S49 family peptidase [Rhodospirillales bacterium]|jgi:signal peptide peptidase SppA